MSGRLVKAVSDMEIDEVSLVRRPANQHATVMIAKAYEGDNMPQETGFFWADGAAIMDDEVITAEDQFFDADGQPFELSDEAIAAIEGAANGGELVGAGAGEELGKSAFFRGSGSGEVSKSLAEQLQETLSKAVGDEGTRDVLSKALEEITKADARAARAEEIAKAEQELRLDREFLEVAKSYGALPVSAEELAPVLKRAAQYLPDEDCEVLHKAFSATGEIMFREFGMTGGGTETGTDPMAVAEAAVAGQIGKSAGDGKETVSKEAATVQYFSENPDAYDELVAGLGR